MNRIYPKIWGKGALFAFSGLDGINTFEDSMCGQLLGDRIGIAFDRCAVELYLHLREARDFEFSIVASDIITGRLNGQQEFGFLFVEQDTLLGFCPKGPAVVCCHGDLLEEQIYDGHLAFSGQNVSYVFATCEKEGRILFSLAKGREIRAAADRAEKAFDRNIRQVIDKKLAFFDKVPQLSQLSEQENMTLAKCFSVMKSQIYTAEGQFGQRWTTPDRLPHKQLWLWDSVFHSMGNVYLEPQLAYESICSVLDTQRSDGFIPHAAWPEGISSITQPPVIAWGLYKLYEQTGHKERLEERYAELEKYLAWNQTHRDTNHNHLFEWDVNPDDVHCRCDESGMDNSPRFDNVKRMDAIDFSCYMANEARYMKKISELLGKKEKAAYYEALFCSIKDSVNGILFDSEDGRYYDRETESGKFRKVSAVSSFLPLFAGVCSQETAKRLARDLFDPKTFGTCFGVPSISVQDATFGEDMWRGPVWINYNYFIINGLREYGYTAEADKMRDDTIAVITEWYLREGVIFEYYDCDNRMSPSELSRKGPALRPADMSARFTSIKDYGWSAALFAAMVMERETHGGKPEIHRQQMI